MKPFKAMLLVTATLGLCTHALAETTIPAGCDDPMVGTVANVTHLNPNGANNLSVHPTPGSYREIDELFTGDSVCSIGQVGPWAHVQYTRDGRGWTGWVADEYLYYPPS